MADRLGRTLAQMLLIKARLALSAGAAHQGQRPMHEMRQCLLGHRLVVARMVELGQPFGGIEHAVGVAEPDPLEHQAAVAGARGDRDAG